MNYTTREVFVCYEQLIGVSMAKWGTAASVRRHRVGPLLGEGLKGLGSPGAHAGLLRVLWFSLVLPGSHKTCKIKSILNNSIKTRCNFILV